MVAVACSKDAPKPPQKEIYLWKQLGSWSGHGGNQQTESFTGLTGALRIKWKTENPTPKGNKLFRLTLASAISGRELDVPVEAKGPGEGVAYVGEDPRVFYVLIESENIDWSFIVEEAALGVPAEKH